MQIEAQKLVYYKHFMYVIDKERTFMKESDFGAQYFNIFGTAKDTTAANLLSACREEKISEETTRKIISVAQISIEQTATNAYPTLWKQVQRFFRK